MVSRHISYSNCVLGVKSENENEMPFWSWYLNDAFFYQKYWSLKHSNIIDKVYKPLDVKKPPTILVNIVSCNPRSGHCGNQGALIVVTLPRVREWPWGSPPVILGCTIAASRGFCLLEPAQQAMNIGGLLQSDSRCSLHLLNAIYSNSLWILLLIKLPT